MKRILAMVNVGVIAGAAFAFGPAIAKETRSAACSAMHLGCHHGVHVSVHFTRLS